MTPSTPSPLLAFENVAFRYPDGNVGLDGCSLAITQGSRNALIGANGAGKTTLFQHANGLLRPQSGAIRYAGHPLDYSRDGLRRLRSAVGLVFQNPDDQLFSPTVFEDVAFGPLHLGLPEAEVRRRAERALAQVGLAGFEDRLPHHLSLGQKKRVAIATVLSMEPEILVLDEPTAGLDPRGRRLLIDLLRDLPWTMLVSTHDIRLVSELFPRTIVMDEGLVVADGPTAVLLADVPFLEAHGLESPFGT